MAPSAGSGGFEQIKPGARLRGLDPAGIAEVVSVSNFGNDAINLVFRVDGRVAERLVYRGEETSFELISVGRTYAFDADGGLLRLASEAYRIRLAHLFDPYLAISASQIEALPHQITAVYGEMLPRQPLRFLLADDPGAGKTIMAGLLIKELLIRGDLERCMIVAPGSLVEQWQEELSEKFGLNFDLLTRDQIEASVTGNPFVEKNRLIVRLDMAARSDELKGKLDAAPDWDLIICDEAHRMAASYFGGEVKETRRHKLGKLLGTRTRNLLLMSATPHNGKEADFQLFMGLLDADRFEGRFREGVHKADVTDMMRRMTKEELYRFDGTPLFPERRAYTASYALSPVEANLYQAVTTYVREEMNRADRSGDDKRRSNVGFALQILQRRLASSPAAIHRSLERRRKRLEERLREEKLMRQTGSAPLSHVPALPSYDPDDIDEVPGNEAEEAEEQIVDQATAAATLAELEAEIIILRDLEERALRLKLSGQDAKWRELESILDEPLMLDSTTGLRRKVIIFTEPKDTLEYLQQKITARVGESAAVVVIHGGIAREARRAAIAAFNSDPVVRVMIANDAEANLGTARDVMRKALAWKQIVDDRRLHEAMTTSQIADAEDKARTNRDSALKAVRAAWSHILYAVKSDIAGKPFELEHSLISSRDRTAIPSVVYDKAKADGIALEKLGTERLWLALKPIWPADRDHLPISELTDWFSSYVYLPKLRDRVVLETSIRDAVAKLDPQFGYADGFDEASGKYHALLWAKDPPQPFPATAMLVSDAATKKQLAEKAAAGQTTPAGASAAPGASPGATVHTPSITQPRKARRFYGSVELDMVRPVKAFDAVLNAIVMELQRTQGAKVKLTLEIEAVADEGFSDNDVSVVRDNARQLKFKPESTGFED
jgi:superfamily II DNA or RNA helicase